MPLNRIRPSGNSRNTLLAIGLLSADASSLGDALTAAETNLIEKMRSRLAVYVEQGIGAAECKERLTRDAGGK